MDKNWKRSVSIQKYAEVVGVGKAWKCVRDGVRMWMKQEVCARMELYYGATVYLSHTRKRHVGLLVIKFNDESFFVT